MEFTNLPSKTHNCIFLECKTVEKELRKVEIPNLASKVQTSFLQLFDKETLKGKLELEGIEKGKKRKQHFEHPGVDWKYAI